MPHLTLRVSPGGPLLDILVGVSQAREEALKKASQPVPPLVKGLALVDTGASCSCMDPSIFSSLGLTPTGSVLVYTPSTGTTPHNADQYDVSLLIPLVVPISRRFSSLPVTASNLAHYGFQALIGRDILMTGLLIYDGQAGIFTLAL